MNLLKLSIALVVSLALFPAASLFAGEPGWTNRVIMTGAERAHYKKIPIQFRPYRPLHVYGNMVRRRYYRGQTAPRVRDVTTTSRILLSRN